MSGIAGLFRFTGPVHRRELERTAGALQLYGPDRSSIRIEHSVGLVHALMRMTPEDQFDLQPEIGQSGALITADLRLDNRNEVLERIGVGAATAKYWPDSRILLRAWEKFGHAIWPHLRGPFAAAIWDPRQHALILARDHLGLNALMWHRGEDFFAFASMPCGLFALQNVPRQLNEEKFADFLVLNHAEHRTTIYRSIFRVSPGAILRITDEGSVLERQFWSPKDIEPVSKRSDAEYAEGLRAVLETAVRRQMRSRTEVACLLSGGLDSSAVTAVAAKIAAGRGARLWAYTGVPRAGFAGKVPAGCYADPRPYVEAIRRAIPNIDVNYICITQPDPRLLERLFLCLQSPVRNPMNLDWYVEVLQLARARGHRVLLGGLFGNATISWDGWSQTAGHLLRARLLKAFRQYQLHYRLTSLSRWQAFRHLFLEPLAPNSIVELWRQRLATPWVLHSPILSSFAVEQKVRVRARKQGHDLRYRRRLSERVELLRQADYIGDWNAAEKSLSGVEVRDPTADIDVVSYCFGIPPDQYLAEGIDRSLVRRAMWGEVPDCVLTNRTIGIQAADWQESLKQRQGEFAKHVHWASESQLVKRSIDVERLRRAIDNWPNMDWESTPIFIEYNLALQRGVAAARFLRWFESAN